MASDEPDRTPAQWHRILTLLADISLFIGTREVWTSAASHQLAIAALISLCYASILVTGVLTLVVRSSRSLAQLDLVVLVTAVALAYCALSVKHGFSDESILTTQAAREILHGHPVYGQPWPWLFGNGIAYTPTVTGGYDYTYGYPPLTALLTTPLLWLGHSALPETLVTTTAMVLGAIVMWKMLPTQWRSAATMVCLGFGMVPTYARLGYPAVVALALLIPVVVRWTRMGAGGPADWARAACLGAACAAQQLPWFLAPFLLAGVFALRRGELGARGAAAAVGRIVGIAAGTWLLINAYFIVSEPRTWLSGIALPITQGAVIHGQGLVGISLYYTDGSDRLSWYSHASMLLAAGLLALFVLFVRRLGPAATVLPWCAFFLATRSQDGYYLLMTPLWLAAAVTVPPSAFTTAWQPRVLSGRRAARMVLAGAVVAPSLVAVILGATGRPPLHMQAAAVSRTPLTVKTLGIKVRNSGDAALEPHFMVTTGQGMSRYWKVLAGPSSVAAHATATYRIQAPDGGFAIPKDGTRIRLRAFSASPMTLSSQDIHLKREQVPSKDTKGSKTSKKSKGPKKSKKSKASESSKTSTG
ncbi:hypothetical protein [Streptomyces gibsoniae]|uniref:Integral membrane protein n=1 Tax=Streptomyces gibsoniae TaxID=3075529 RepID=A0ABU2TN47_9ACTN|nr:hypothetical protein [Streptomyces sp. DSM 41699]MDT0462271.1 hypothetical protein [Streptomyces sp. DSM 41699]